MSVLLCDWFFSSVDLFKRYTFCSKRIPLLCYGSGIIFCGLKVRKQPCHVSFEEFCSPSSQRCGCCPFVKNFTSISQVLAGQDMPSLKLVFKLIFKLGLFWWQLKENLVNNIHIILLENVGFVASGASGHVIYDLLRPLLLKVWRKVGTWKKFRNL